MDSGPTDASEGWAPVDQPPPGYGPPPSPTPPGDGYPPPPPGYGYPPHGYGYPPPGYGYPPPLPKGGSARTGPLPLHPMGLSDILDGAFKLMKANARTVFTIVAAIMVPLQLLAAFASRNAFGGGGSSIIDTLSDPSLVEAGSGQTVADLVLLGLSTLASLIVLPLLAGAISQVVAASYLGQELAPGTALRATFRRTWALLASWVLVHLLEILPFVVLVLAIVAAAVSDLAGVAVLIGVLGFVGGVFGGFAVMALSVPVAPAIVVEELGPLAGIRRSWSLVRRRFWPVLGVALLAGLISSFVGQILGVVPTIAALFVPGSWAWVLIGLGGVLTALVATPIVAIVATLQYFDLRIRTEGFDLQVIAAELGAPR